MTKIVASVVCASLSLCLSASAGGIRAVQLDLARQKETPEFVKRYMKLVKEAGYNTMVLYLEDRIKTQTYPYCDDADSYSVAEMKDIVSTGVELGLDLVPVVSPLGHTERFLAHPELARFGEQCQGVGRWGKCDNPECFCLENPEAREWMARYISEVAEIFPGRNFHFGFDEAWNLGYCTRCGSIVEREGLDELYLRHVIWAHGLATRLGKRMWMWDDYFDFFPEKLARLPRDIVLCNWNYDSRIDRTGPRAHLGGRLRRDTLKIAGSLGFDVLACPWFELENIRTFTEYAQSRKTAGFFFTQWEMETDFHSIFIPRVFAAAELWNQTGDHVSGEWIDKGLRRAFPTVDADTLRMIRGLMFDQLKLKFTQISEDSILNGAPATSRSAYWETALQMLCRLPSHPGVGKIPTDSFSEEAFLEDLTVRTEMALTCMRTADAGRYLLFPDRTEAAAKSAKAELARFRSRWLELVRRRAEQWSVWRPGVRSSREEKYRSHLPKLIDDLTAKPNVAPCDEWLFEFDPSGIDTHFVPMWNVEVRTDGGEWLKIAEGGWKPSPDGRPYQPKFKCVTVGKGTPSALRLTYRGYGAGSLCHLSLRNRDGRLVPTSVISATDNVRDAVNLLTDNFYECRMGMADCSKTFLLPERAKVTSAVVLGLGREL